MMKINIIICALSALCLSMQINCIQVIEDKETENSTTILEPLSTSQKDENVLETTTYESSSNDEKARNIESDHQITTSSTTTTTTTHRIPPTLMNTRVEFNREPSEKTVKSLKDYANPTVAHFHPKTMGQVIDAKVKQAIINSKEQAFKNLNAFNIKHETNKQASQDQVAKPAEVQNDISKDNPKDFLPSPELSPLYSRENKLEDHFHPMNHYYRTVKQDARFPTETPFSSNPVLDTRWLSGNRPSNDIGHHSYGSTQHPQQGRSTYVDFPPYQNVQHVHRHFQHEEKFSFPPDDHSIGEDIRSTPWSVHNQAPQPVYKGSKGTWKWIPDEEYSPRNFSDYHYSEPENKVTSYGSQFSYEQPPRPQTSRDRPYPFDTHDGSHYNHFHNHHAPVPAALVESTRLPTGPASWPSSGSDTLLTTEEYVSGKHEEHIKSGHSDKKQLRPSPWKKIIHVLGAAIPIGIIISALTPRIVYVHPNATVPSLQSPLNPNQFVNPNQFGDPNQQFIPPSGQVNGPFPLRTRDSTLDGVIDPTLAQFLKAMETKYAEKQHRNGDVLDGSCEDRYFCEIALMGTLPTADDIHRTLYNVALETPNEVAKRSGLGEVFKAIKRQNCDVFKCSKKLH